MIQKSYVCKKRTRHLVSKTCGSLLGIVISARSQLQKTRKQEGRIQWQYLWRQVQMNRWYPLKCLVSFSEAFGLIAGSVWAAMAFWGFRWGVEPQFAPFGRSFRKAILVSFGCSLSSSGSSPPSFKAFSCHFRWIGVHMVSVAKLLLAHDPKQRQGSPPSVTGANCVSLCHID